MGELVMLCTTNPSKVDKLLNTDLNINDLVDIFNWGDPCQRSLALEKLKKETGTLEKWVEIYKNNRSNKLLPIVSQKIKQLIEPVTDFDELIKTFNICHKYKMVSPERIIIQHIEQYPASLDELVYIYRIKDPPHRIMSIIYNRIRHELSLITDKTKIPKFEGITRVAPELHHVISQRLSELS